MKYGFLFKMNCGRKIVQAGNQLLYKRVAVNRVPVAAGPTISVVRHTVTNKKHLNTELGTSTAEVTEKQKRRVRLRIKFKIVVHASGSTCFRKPTLPSWPI